MHKLLTFLGCLTVGALVTTSFAPSYAGDKKTEKETKKSEKTDKKGDGFGPPGSPQATHMHLEHGYALLFEAHYLGQAAKMSKEKVESKVDCAAIYDDAVKLYNAALKETKGGNMMKAYHMASSSNEAAMGLHHMIQGSLPMIDAIPSPGTVMKKPDNMVKAPPAPAMEPGAPIVYPESPTSPNGIPWVRPYKMIVKASECCREACEAPKGECAGILAKASRMAFEEARTQYTNGMYERATHFAMAAESFAKATKCATEAEMVK